MLNTFRNSFFSIWFDEIPDEIVTMAIAAVEDEQDSQVISGSCPALYENYVVYSTTIFLMTFMDTGGSFDINLPTGEDGAEESFSMKSLRDNGYTAMVKRDWVGTYISREYQVPKFPEGMKVEHFPFGYLVKQIDTLKVTCDKSQRFVGGVGSNIPKKPCYAQSGSGKRDYSMGSRGGRCRG